MIPPREKMYRAAGYTTPLRGRVKLAQGGAGNRLIPPSLLLELASEPAEREVAALATACIRPAADHAVASHQLAQALVETTLCDRQVWRPRSGRHPQIDALYEQTVAHRREAMATQSRLCEAMFGEASSR